MIFINYLKKWIQTILVKLNNMLNGIVYKLKCLDKSIEDFYIGSSVDIKKRIASHKSDCNNSNSKKYNFKVYKFIRNNGGWDNWEFEILLEVSVISKEELRIKYERPYQLDLKPDLNVRVEGRTIDEWYEDNKKEKLKKKKEFYEDNKEEKKEYYEDHKEEILEKRKEKYKNNKEEILEKAKEKILCDECGIYYTKSNKSQHLNSKKHIKCLNENDIE